MYKGIIKYPDKLLRDISEPIKDIDSSILGLIQDMKEIVKNERLSSLSAIQIGEALRIFVLSYKGELIALINPKIIKSHGIMMSVEECSSLPIVQAERGRFAVISITYLDEKGIKRIIEVDENDMTTASLIQHEMDHLDGKLFIDTLPKLQKSSLIKKMINRKKIFLP